MDYSTFNRYIGRLVERQTTSDSEEYRNWSKHWSMEDVYEAVTTAKDLWDRDPYEYCWDLNGKTRIHTPKKRNQRVKTEVELVDDAVVLDEFLAGFSVNK